jgi:hypothetical protein
MTTHRAKRNAGLVLVVASVAASSILNLAAATSAKDEAGTNYVQLQDLGQKTDQCVQSSPSTDSPACVTAAQKAKEVQAQPIIVTAPRRTDAEVKELIVQAIREHPELVPRGAKGETYELTDADKQAIADMVLGKIPTPKNGDPGAAGKDAVVDYDKIVKAVVALIPVPKDGVDGVTPPCMATPAQCQGAAGDTGEAGRGIDPDKPPEYVRREGGQCVLRMYFTKAPTTVDIPTGTFSCPL